MTSTQHTTDLRERLQLALGSGYEVGEEFGRGGMSRVFAARDLTLKRDIVVKTLPPELGGDISVERFTREIHFAASLQHPHIVPVHAAGDVDGLPYYTMPRVEGESLRERLHRAQRLPLAEVMTVMRDVGRALAYAHRRGLVHRDIKPENILIAEGLALVTDFGIAKALAAARIDDTPGPVQTTANESGITATGTYLGTPNYVAPEQAAADLNVDHRADLFALGVVAYEMLCGHTPFATRGRQVSAAQFAFKPHDVALQRLDLPPMVAALVMQCLEIDPSARPQSAEEIVRTLDAAMSATPLAPVGDDPSVAPRAFGWYAVAFVMTTGLAWAAMIGLGLPDWVLPGTTIIMALGLPVVTTVALARKAAFESSLERNAGVSRIGWLFTPGPATIRIAQALTWRRVVAGGGLSLGGFGILVAGFMITRTLGIGPAGSLLAKGQVTRNQPILIADFTSSPSDSSIAKMAREAVGLGLQESNIVRVMTPQSITEALERMRRAPSERLTSQLARDVARREGISVIADGEVIRDGQEYLLRVRLVAADSGNVLATSVAAVGSAALVSGIDRITRELRGKIGESLKLVRSSPPLEKATTSSFEALVLYTQGSRAYDLEGNTRKSRELLLRALELDSTFALAWRKLTTVTSYLTPVPPGGWKPSAREALDQAFRYRANASIRERLQIEGSYYFANDHDRPRALAAFDEYARRIGVPLHNHAWFLVGLHQFAKSESLFRAILAADSMNPLSHKGLLWALMSQGKHREADSLGRVAMRRFPFELHIALAYCGMRQFQKCEAGLDSLRRERQARDAIYSLADLALMRGQVLRWNQLNAEAARTASGPMPVARLVRSANVDIVIRGQPHDGVARLDSLEEFGRRANNIFQYALAGRVDRAQSLLDSIERAQPDSTLVLGPRAFRRFQRASLAAAQGRWQAAIDGFRASRTFEDGLPRPTCTECISLEIARVFDASGAADSAIVFYERFLSEPQYNPHFNEFGAWLGHYWWKFVNEAWIHERLGRLYESTNRDRAAAHLAAFIDLWKDADPELQPRVATAREKLARLRAS